MTEAKELLEAAGITVETRREHADPEEAIVALAREVDADQIVMAGRKRTPVGKAVFGSVTQSVLLKADLPVTVTSTE
jgi:nucleotide-binding universal stress UspA family protein